MQTKWSIFNGKKSNAQNSSRNDIHFDLEVILISQNLNNFSYIFCKQAFFAVVSY